MPLRPCPAALAVLLAAPLAAQMDYSVAIDLEAKLWEVEGRIANPSGEPLDFWLARWTPGAYHRVDFGQWIQDLTAFDAEGDPLPVERVEDSHWRIDAEGVFEIVVRYRGKSISKGGMMEIFRVIDVEANRIADDYAFLNPISLFGFVPERLDEPFSLRLELPEGWRAATALPLDGDVYRAPSFYVFEDSPLLLSPELVSLEREAAGKPLGIHVHGRDEVTAEELAEACVSIAEATAELMQGAPYERYDFLFGFVSEGMGSGLEHASSTLILVPPTVPSDDLWHLAAHEFFHLWTAERIRVEGLHRPDYTRLFETSTIWINEGFTDYFSRHVLLHAGLSDRDAFLESLTAPDPMTEFLSDSLEVSWTEVSREASDWTSPSELMTFVAKMYAQGPRTVFALDLEMRRASGGERGLLDLLRLLRWAWVELDRGFTEGEMIALASGVAQADLTQFYERYIDGPQVPDLGPLLPVIGYRLADGEVREVEDPTEEQLRAREDFFSISG